MRTPKNLKGAAAEFWRKHAPHLQQNNLLDEATSDAFLLLAQLWGELQDNRPTDPMRLVALSKRVSDGFKSFGLDPASRKKLLPPKTDTEEDEFGI